VIERPVRNHFNSVGRETDLGHEAIAAVATVHDHGIGLPPKTSLRPDLTGPRLAGENVVSCHHQWPLMRQQPHVNPLNCQPLGMNNVKGRGRAAPGEHVRQVPGRTTRPKQS
jgi:hypothetical protein